MVNKEVKKWLALPKNLFFHCYINYIVYLVVGKKSRFRSSSVTLLQFIRHDIRGKIGIFLFFCRSSVTKCGSIP